MNYLAVTYRDFYRIFHVQHVAAPAQRRDERDPKIARQLEKMKRTVGLHWTTDLSVTIIISHHASASVVSRHGMRRLDTAAVFGATGTQLFHNPLNTIRKVYWFALWFAQC
jgi:hypothetical protein